MVDLLIQKGVRIDSTAEEDKITPLHHGKYIHSHLKYQIEIFFVLF